MYIKPLNFLVKASNFLGRVLSFTHGALDPLSMLLPIRLWAVSEPANLLPPSRRAPRKQSFRGLGCTHPPYLRHLRSYPNPNKNQNQRIAGQMKLCLPFRLSDLPEMNGLGLLPSSEGESKFPNHLHKAYVKARVICLLA